MSILAGRAPRNLGHPVNADPRTLLLLARHATLKKSLLGEEALVVLRAYPYLHPEYPGHRFCEEAD